MRTSSTIPSKQIKNLQRIAIIGGGPAALFIFKRLVENCDAKNFTIDVFERKKQLGAGLPYSTDGANVEHVTNISGNEIPEIVTTLQDWIKTVSQEKLQHFDIDAKSFNDYKVIPRLLFGEYLEAQFKLLIDQAAKKGLPVKIYVDTIVQDVIDMNEQVVVCVQTSTGQMFEFDKIIICSGHNFPLKHEVKTPGYFESPYPPSKIAFKTNAPVAIRGSSLTAIDAIKTLARQHGLFKKDKNGKLNFFPDEDSSGFKIIMHSRNGLLPAVRFHLDDSHLSKDSVLSKKEIENSRAENDGFVPLDFVFDKFFKETLKEKQPWFYEKIRHMQLEEFVDEMMKLRENVEPFNLFEAEYIQAAQSIKRKESIYWKEMLAVLSFAMNYPAKYFSAEDMLRLQKKLMPLISIVIAFVPQSSVEELLALHKANVLDIISVDDKSHVEPVPEGGAIYHYIDDSDKQQSVYYKTYVDCVGQPHLSLKDIPYKSLISNKTISEAQLKFRDNKAGKKELMHENKNVIKDADSNYFLRVPGITINDNFQVVNEKNKANEKIFIMAVPYIGGFNPDYSGLDFGEAASAKIIEKIVKHDVVN